MIAKFIYILFVAAVNALMYGTLYIKINRKGKITLVLWVLWAATIVAIALHAEVLKIGFLLPLNDLMMVLLWSLAAPIAHLLIEFYLERVENSNWLKRRTMAYVVKIASVFRALFYILITLMQFAALIAIMERYSP